MAVAYRLRGLTIERPNQVWAADICYVPMAKGFLYLVAVMDRSSRKVLAWRVSNTMDTEFCLEVLEEALDRYGAPEIFNTDHVLRTGASPVVSTSEPAGGMDRCRPM